MKYIFQPERNEGTAESTNFVFCEPEQAEIWAIYADGCGGTELLGDLHVPRFDRLLSSAFAGMSTNRVKQDDKNEAVLAGALRSLLAAIKAVQCGQISVGGQTVCRAVHNASAALIEIDD